jgi:hypothetical protein
VHVLRAAKVILVGATRSQGVLRHLKPLFFQRLTHKMNFCDSHHFTGGRKKLTSD